MLRYILSRSLAAIPLLWLAITALFVVFLSVVRQLSDRIAVMYRGGIVELARTDLLFSQPQHEYTRKLLSAVASVDSPEVPRS